MFLRLYFKDKYIQVLKKIRAIFFISYRKWLKILKILVTYTLFLNDFETKIFLVQNKIKIQTVLKFVINHEIFFFS